MKASEEIAFYSWKCIRCGACKEACSQQAIDLSRPGQINRKKCIVCGNCANECPAKALRIIGKFYTTKELTDIILTDRYYYETSKGGVTFSGGEPALHINFLHEVMTKLHKENIHIAIQTCGMINLPAFKEKLLPFINLIFYDIKIIDSDKHKKHTGSGNEQILHNFKYLLEESRRHGNFEIISRTPVIPGVNDSEEDISALLNFYKNLNYTGYRLLQYNSGGISKNETLGIIHDKR